METLDFFRRGVAPQRLSRFGEQTTEEIDAGIVVD
jgi:hypothetical protein